MSKKRSMLVICPGRSVHRSRPRPWFTASTVAVWHPMLPSRVSRMNQSSRPRSLREAILKANRVRTKMAARMIRV